MFTRKHTSAGDLYYEGTITVDDVILHCRFFPNEPKGTPRFMIDGREAAHEDTHSLAVTPGKSLTRNGRMTELHKIMARQAKDFKP